MNQDKIWDYFQNQGQASFLGDYSRQRALVRQLKRGERVLNIGVGAGLFERLCVQAGVDVHVLDPNSTSIERIAMDLSLREKAKVGYADNIPFEDGRFDAVVMSEVIEHIPPEMLTAVLREVARVLRRSGGRLLGTVPAMEDLSQSVVICPNCGYRHHRWGHMQSFTPSTLRQLLAERFAEVDIAQKYFPPWEALRWKGRLETIVKLVFRAFGTQLADEKLFFVARKR